jgi:hypothetical protein
MCIPSFTVTAAAAVAAAAAAAACLQTSLANWWNVYDAFNVWRTYGVRAAAAAATCMQHKPSMRPAWLFAYTGSNTGACNTTASSSSSTSYMHAARGINVACLAVFFCIWQHRCLKCQF